MKYRCVKTLWVDRYDDDGFLDDEPIEVQVGAIYDRYDDRHYCTEVDSRAIHLEDDSGNWLELVPETISEYFEELKEREKNG